MTIVKRVATIATTAMLISAQLLAPPAVVLASPQGSTTNRSAAPVTPPDISETQEILAAEGLDEVESEIVNIPDVGDVTFEYDFIGKTITMRSPDGTVDVVGFDELAALSSNADLTSSPTSFRLETRAAIDKEKVCRALATAVGGGHKTLWQTALKLAGVNPAVRAALWLGETGLWLYVKSNC